MNKPITLLYALVITACAIVSFRPSPAGEKDLARVTRYQGIYIFIQSQPIADYTVLGTVKKTGIVMSGDPTEMYETLIKKARKSYEDVEGIIFDDVKMEHATVIKFK